MRYLQVALISIVCCLITACSLNNPNGGGNNPILNLNTNAFNFGRKQRIATNLYPNPASTQITIDVPQVTVLEKATIYNSLGQLVLSSKSTTINTSTLSQGVYIVEVKTNQGSYSKKLIVE